MAASYYTVLDGDTWASVAAMHNISVRWLQQANGIDPDLADPGLLEPGSLLNIPDPPPPVNIAPESDNTVSYAPPFLAAFGPTIEFVIRCYAPFDDFGSPLPGFGFEGDARDYSTDPFTTARITSIGLFDVNAHTVTFRAFSNQTAFPNLPFKYDEYSYWPRIIPHLQATATATPKVKGSSAFAADGEITSITFTHGGGNPLIPGAPDIDLHVVFSLHLDDDGNLVVHTKLTGDGFPNAEAFVRLGDGRAILLHHYEVPFSDNPFKGGYWYGPFTGPFTRLYGDPQRNMGESTIVIPPPQASQ